MAFIEKIYRSRIDYEVPEPNWDEALTAVYTAIERTAVLAEHFNFSPCSNAVVIFEGPSRNETLRVALKFQEWVLSVGGSSD